MTEFSKEIKKRLNKELSVETVETIDSTNRALKELAEKGEAEGHVLLAESQTAGRGRMGRSFFSPPGSGLYFSVLLRPRKADPLQITVAAGVAVARAVQKVLGMELQIKWVNDLYRQDKKVCGILAEGASDEAGLRWCVLGIGLNVYAPREGFGELDEIAGALLEGEPELSVRSALASEILNEFFAIYETPLEGYLEEYRSRSYLDGRNVTVLQGEKSFPAKVVGIGEKAELLVKKNDGSILALHSGEVQIKKFR